MCPVGTSAGEKNNMGKKREGAGAAVLSRMIGWSLRGHLGRNRRDWGSGPHGILGECLAGGRVGAKALWPQWAECRGQWGWCVVGVGHGSESVGHLGPRGCGKALTSSLEWVGGPGRVLVRARLE